MMLKKTKVICTQGPSTDPEGIVDALIESGMNCARFNFSHGSHEEHLVRIQKVRAAAERSGKVISLILDTKGPEMRLGEFAAGKVQLEKGKQFTLTHDDAPGDETHVSVNHKQLYTEVKPGDTLLLSDGLVGLVVDEIRGKDIVTTIQNSGSMSTRKRVAAPGIELSLPAISEQDEKDIIFGIENDMDFVAASFIQRPADVEEIRRLIEKHGGHMEIIPKIENLAGVNNFDAILAVSDGIMVARGDLGVEVPAEDVPVIQKEIIRKCNAVGKPVIVATQMLESMTTNPRPTRAEVSDVGNAIFDGADAIMLSGETASGDYPVEAVQTMSTIALRMEESLEYDRIIRARSIRERSSVTDAVSHATVQLAYETSAAAILTPTQSGYTTRVVSKYRPKATIVAYAPSPMVARHINLRWGVYSILGRSWSGVEDMIESCTRGALSHGYVKQGDKIVMVSGMTYSEASSVAVRVATIH